jgi:predicted anti-sigma-YlaC factor YlaD
VLEAGSFLAAAAVLIAALLIIYVLRQRSTPITAESGSVVGMPAEIVCQELVELVTDYLDGALPPDLHDQLRRHLDDCDGCVEYVRQVGVTIQALEAAKGQLRPEPPPQ